MRKNNSETIAAISTALGEGGIAIIRISGSEAANIARRILYDTRNFETPGLMKLTSLIEPDSCEVLDRVLCVRFKAPKSYTGEDIVEIHTHGGILLARTCLQMVLRNGARIAEPGEFTRRAFLNGRIDLSEAEGVLGVIKSQSMESLRASARTLTGGLSEIVREIYQEILRFQGDLEIALDFPEGVEFSGVDLREVFAIRARLEDLRSRCSAGILLLNGVRVVIAGLPNAGKSSLMNALLRKQRAIVTEIPGTTRDVIEESVNFDGVPLRLTDTAGLRESGDLIEREGIELARNAIRESDICLWVIDSSRGITDYDVKFLRENHEENHASNLIIILNKCDLQDKPHISELSSEFPDLRKIFISAKTGFGLEDLKAAILEISRGGSVLEFGLNASEKQMSYLDEAIELVDQICECENNFAASDVIAGLLNSARNCLMSMLGFEGFKNNEELLDSIFSRFCVGK